MTTRNVVENGATGERVNFSHVSPRPHDRLAAQRYLRFSTHRKIIMSGIDSAITRGLRRAGSLSQKAIWAGQRVLGTVPVYWQRRYYQKISKRAEVVSKAATEGDLNAARLVLQLLVPPAKGRLVSFPMPEIKMIDDIAGALQALWGAVSTSAISIDEMPTLTAVLEKHGTIIHASELKKRVIALEAAKTPKLEYRNQP
jgi:hypothetical protein